MSFFEELNRRNVFRVGIAYGVTAWLLIQVSDTVFPRIGLSESAVTLVIALLGIGFLPALLFAWAFEMTPEGIRRERDVNRAESITPRTGKKLDRVIIAILAGAVVWLLVDKYYLDDRDGSSPANPATVASNRPQEAGGPSHADGKPTAKQKSIAVLPFLNMSPDKENEYFSDGIAEELLNVLVRVSALEVASRTSSFAYKGKDLPLSQVARELGVNHILEGSVRKAGNRVRITAQLIDAESDRHLWSDSYERELDDIFEIQEEISGHIVDALKVALDMGEAAEMRRLQRPTDNAEAYELYLQGRFQWRKRQEENLRNAIDLFEQAVALDPGFAKAHEALSSAHAVLPAWSDANLRDSLAESARHAERALALDPTLAEARAGLAHFKSLQHHWAQVLDEFKAALASEPRNATVRQWYAEMLADLGYLNEALGQIEQAYRIDPASPVINNVYTYIASGSGRDELALRQMRRAMQLGMDFAPLNALPALVRLEDWSTIENLVHPLIGANDTAMTCLEASIDPGLLPKLRQLLEAGSGDAPQDPYCLALAGRLDAAFEVLQRRLRADPAAIGDYWGEDPGSTTLRQAPEFKEMLVELRLVDLYRERGWPDRCRPTGEVDFECD